MFFKNIIKDQGNTVYEKSEELKEVRAMIEKLKVLNTEISSKDFMIESIQEDYKRIFNLFSDIIVIIDKTGTIIDLNNSCTNYFVNFFKEPLIGKKWKDVMVNFNCNWEESIEKKLMENKELVGLSKEIYIEKLKNHFIITVIPVLKKGELDYFIFTAKDVTLIKERELELIKKQQLITYTSVISDVFTQNLNIDHTLNKIVETLGRIENIDRCCLYQNKLDDKNICYAEKIKEWSSGKNTATKIKLSKIYYNSTFARWKSFMDLNHILCGDVNDFPDSEKRILLMRNIKSVCVVPISTPVLQWGFIKFDSCEKIKNWSYDEEKILKIAANIIGAGIYQWTLRNNDEEKIYKSCVNF